jgi:hypothetical protein
MTKTLTIGTVDVIDSFGTRLTGPGDREGIGQRCRGVVTKDNIGLRVSSGDLIDASVTAGARVWA